MLDFSDVALIHDHFAQFAQAHSHTLILKGHNFTNRQLVEALNNMSPSLTSLTIDTLPPPQYQLTLPNLRRLHVRFLWSADHLKGTAAHCPAIESFRAEAQFLDVVPPLRSLPLRELDVSKCGRLQPEAVSLIREFSQLRSLKIVVHRDDLAKLQLTKLPLTALDLTFEGSHSYAEVPFCWCSRALTLLSLTLLQDLMPLAMLPLTSLGLHQCAFCLSVFVVHLWLQLSS